MLHYAPIPFPFPVVVAVIWGIAFVVVFTSRRVVFKVTIVTDYYRKNKLLHTIVRYI